MILISATHPDLLPTRATKDSVGHDLKSSKDLVILAPGDIKLVETGVTVQMDPGTEAQVRSRSGLALNDGIIVLNSPGTIDPDYLGEIKVILCNLGKEAKTIKKGDKIAQLVFAKVELDVMYDITMDIIPKVRGSRGFGSTDLDD